MVVAGEQDAGDALEAGNQRTGNPVASSPSGLPDLEKEVDDPTVLFESEEFIGAIKLPLGEDIPNALNTGDKLVVDPPESRLSPSGNIPHEVRQGGLDLVDDTHCPGHEGGFEVAPGALNCLGRRRRFLGDVRHAKVHHRGVEFLGGDLALLHRLTEIPRVSASLEEGLLEFPGRAGNSVGQLVEVLGGEFPLTGGLGKHHADRLECLGVTAGDGVEVTGGLSEFVVALDVVGRQLGGERLNIR